MGHNNAEPLYYAIIRLFSDERERTAEAVMTQLAPTYGTQKLFTPKGIDEALATAKENGLLEESHYSLSSQEALLISYKITDFGREMVRKYLRRKS